MKPERIAELQCSIGIAAGTFPERLAATSPRAQALYRAVLATFAATGAPPLLRAAAEQAQLSAEQAEAGLRELAEADVVAVDARGAVIGVFPLSPVPTRHRVQVAGRPVLHAMCAVDALGIPAMLGEAGVVTSTDPTTGQTITVVIGDGELSVEPSDAVVLLATTGAGSLATSCCSVIDFYADPSSAEQALTRPGVTGVVLTVADGHALGVALFADLPAR